MNYIIFSLALFFACMHANNAVRGGNKPPPLPPPKYITGSDGSTQHPIPKDCEH